MRTALVALALSAGIAQVPEPRLVPISVQLGVRISPATVTVGERFIVVLHIRAPVGATVQFPSTIDSAASSATSVTLVGKPVIQAGRGADTTLTTAAYAMTAWDTGPQPLLLRDIVVRAGGQTGYVSLARYRVNVRSVLPADSLLRVPKPPRGAIPLEPFSKLPWLLLFLLVVLAGIGWWLWQVYKRRRNRQLDPFAAAEAEFARIDAMNLIASGAGDRHVAMTVDTMRTYLAARIPGIELWQTSSELIAASGPVAQVASGLGGVLWRADLVKFAALRTTADEAGEIASSARSVVRSVETEMLKREADAQRNAERRAA